MRRFGCFNFDFDFTAVLGVLKSSQDQANKNITKPLQYIHVILHESNCDFAKSIFCLYYLSI